jgi:hypothetical protein
MITEKSTQTERGQALVIMALGMIVLLIVVGVAVDGGTVFMERRHAQNAADAAALSGTRMLARAVCNEDGADDAAILAEILKIVASNNVNLGEDAENGVRADYVDKDLAVLGAVGGGSIPVGSTGVSTTVDIKRKTYFLSLAGIDTSGASAHALAMTGPPLMAGGMRPFGVPYDMVSQMDPGDWFSISFKSDGGEITWSDAITPSQHRGWMNMGYVWNAGELPASFPRAIDESANAAILKEWMENGWHGGTLYPDNLWRLGAHDGDFIHAKPGTNSSAVCAAPPDLIFPIPIYDMIPDCPTEIDTDRPSCPTQGSSYAYHIVGIASVRITGCSQGGGQIDLELARAIFGEGMPDIGGQTGFGEARACETHTQVVTLWE